MGRGCDTDHVATDRRALTVLLRSLFRAMWNFFFPPICQLDRQERKWIESRGLDPPD